MTSRPHPGYEIEVTTVDSVHLAAARRRVLPEDVRAVWRPALDSVWSFVRTQDGLWSGGHNVFVYRGTADPHEPLTVDFGVEVTRSFEGNGVVIPAETPAGRVASTRHVGRLEGLDAAHAALRAWLVAHREVPGGVSWETYGDWGPDPATWEVRLTYLLDG
ncbi:MAG TPA: GyrI-like domain-containing protein [Candidatus Limnocylindrales bacterium]|nr:GyrI-like domain-containing protein [Candidatus Limnocylindrales bacterium]